MLASGWHAENKAFRDHPVNLAGEEVRSKRRSSYAREGLTRHDEQIAEQWLENDGTLVSGRSILDAFDRLEVLETTAEALINNRSLGESLSSRES